MSIGCADQVLHHLAHTDIGLCSWLGVRRAQMAPASTGFSDGRSRSEGSNIDGGWLHISWGAAWHIGLRVWLIPWRSSVWAHQRPRCFLEQETLPLLLSSGWLQERIWAWFHNGTKINWGPYRSWLKCQILERWCQISWCFCRNCEWLEKKLRIMRTCTASSPIFTEDWMFKVIALSFFLNEYSEVVCPSILAKLVFPMDGLCSLSTFTVICT